MFIEPSHKTVKKGWIEVVCGSMFSGKTEELIRRLKRAQIANLQVQIFKPQIDIRYDKVDIVSHNDTRIKSTPIASSQEILQMITNEEVVGIDEAQFFDHELSDVVELLAQKGIRVICAGLDMDYLRRPFGPMAALLSKADYITKLHAICVVCGDIANYSFRKSLSENTILLGEKESYEPRCRSCYHQGV